MVTAFAPEPVGPIPHCCFTRRVKMAAALSMTGPCCLGRTSRTGSAAYAATQCRTLAAVHTANHVPRDGYRYAMSLFNRDSSSGLA